VLENSVKTAAKKVGGANLVHGLLALPERAAENNAEEENDFDDKGPPLSVRLSTAAALGLVSRAKLTEEENAAIAEAIVRGEVGNRGRLFMSSEAKELNDLSKRHSGLRRQYFRKAHLEIISREDWPRSTLFSITIFHDAITPQPVPPERLREIRRACERVPDLRIILWRSLHPGIIARWTAFRKRHPSTLPRSLLDSHTSPEF